MRFLTLLFITLFVSSCGNQKLRFVRTHRVEQKVVELEDVSTLNKKRMEIRAEEMPEISKQNEVSATETGQVSDQSEMELEGNSTTNEQETANFPTVKEDSVELTQEEVTYIQDEASRSEKQGRWSFIFSLLTYLFLALGILGIIILANLIFFTSSPYLIGWTVLTILMGVLFLGSLISSITLGIKSLRARYTTPKGKRLAIAGLILSGIMVLLWLVNLAFSL